MSKNLQRILFILFLILPPFILEGVLLADEAPIITSVTKGTKIPSSWNGKWPFDGILLNVPAWAQIEAERKIFGEECSLRLQYELDKADAKCQLMIDNGNAHIEAMQFQYDEVVQLKNDEIQRLDELIAGNDDTDWGSLFFAGGVVVGVLVSIGVVYAMSGAF